MNTRPLSANQLKTLWTNRAQRGTEAQTTGTFHARGFAKTDVQKEQETGLWETLKGF